MLFQRRTPPSRTERLKTALWPRQSWGRSIKYYSKRVLRLKASPHAIALGFAAGAAVSFTPFVGFHFIMSAVIALVLGGNVIASSIGTFIGNPLTFPVMWFSAFALGRWLLGLEHAPPPKVPIDRLFHAPWEEIWAILHPWLIGAVPLGIGFGAIIYFIVRALVAAYQKSRQKRLESRRTGQTQSMPMEP